MNQENKNVEINEIAAKALREYYQELQSYTPSLVVCVEKDLNEKKMEGASVDACVFGEGKGMTLRLSAISIDNTEYVIKDEIFMDVESLLNLAEIVKLHLKLKNQ